MMNLLFIQWNKLSTSLPQRIFALFLIGLIVGCGNSSKAPDVSDVKIELKTQRLDKDLAALDTNQLAAGLQSIAPKYPEFLNFYLDTLMGFGIEGNYTDSSHGINKGLKTFLTHKDYRGLLDTVAKHYTDTKITDEELTKAFQYLRHYDSNYKVPQVIYFVSGLNNWGAFTYGDDIIGIGLDMFLGQSYPFYSSVGIPEYMGNKLESNYISVAVFKAVYQNQTPFVPEGKDLLDMMIQKGKELYFLDKVLPFKADALKIGYTEKQMEWCTKNEALVYNFFIHENFLYEKNWQKILRYVTDGPTSAGIPDSPGNIGSWIGWQIVRAYMNEHPEMTLPELINDKTEARVFLQQSKYKPK